MRRSLIPPPKRTRETPATGCIIFLSRTKSPTTLHDKKTHTVEEKFAGLLLNLLLAKSRNALCATLSSFE
jgi:hypothetical protein